MTENTPKSIEEYLSQLRAALAGEDPALIQDALYDAEEYLRAELAANVGRPQSEVIADIVRSYGAPDEVAAVYRQQEATVKKALATPRPAPRDSWLGRFFSVLADPRAYAALFYMLLSMATGIVYFTWTVTGWSLSLGFMVLIIGIPFLLLFLGATRLLSLLEGRIVEVMLGVRMPRRPVYQAQGNGLLSRIGDMLSDLRTWATFVYMLAMLPLGIAYFTIAVSGLSVTLSLLFAPIWALFDGGQIWWGGELMLVSWWWTPLLSLLGFVGIVILLHLARGIGHLHGQLAKVLLVRVEADS